MNCDHMLPDGQLQPFEGRGHLQWDPLGISYEQGRRGRTCTPFRTPLSQDPAIPIDCNFLKIFLEIFTL